MKNGWKVSASRSQMEAQRAGKTSWLVSVIEFYGKDQIKGVAFQ